MQRISLFRKEEKHSVAQFYNFSMTAVVNICMYGNLWAKGNSQELREYLRGSSQWEVIQTSSHGIGHVSERQMHYTRRLYVNIVRDEDPTVRAMLSSVSSNLASRSRSFSTRVRISAVVVSDGCVDWQTVMGDSGTKWCEEAAFRRTLPLS